MRLTYLDQARSTTWQYPFDSHEVFCNPFTSIRREYYRAEIDPREIVGSSHPSYEGRTWREFPQFCKPNSLETAHRKGMDVTNKCLGWTICSITDRPGLFAYEGIHRSVVAKLRGHEHGWTFQDVPCLVKTSIDRHDEKLFKKLQDALPNPVCSADVMIAEERVSECDSYFSRRFKVYGVERLHGRLLIPGDALRELERAIHPVKHFLGMI